MNIISELYNIKNISRSGRLDLGTIRSGGFYAVSRESNLDANRAPQTLRSPFVDNRPRAGHIMVDGGDSLYAPSEYLNRNPFSEDLPEAINDRLFMDEYTSSDITSGALFGNGLALGRSEDRPITIIGADTANGPSMSSYGIATLAGESMYATAQLMDSGVDRIRSLEETVRELRGIIDAMQSSITILEDQARATRSARPVRR